MITVVPTSGTFRQAELPWVTGFQWTSERPVSEEISLSGAVIRQSGAKADSMKTASYEGWVPRAHADILRRIDEAVSTVVISDGLNVYVAQMAASVNDTVRNGKKQVTATFRVVRTIFEAP